MEVLSAELGLHKDLGQDVILSWPHLEKSLFLVVLCDMASSLVVDSW